jgi:predicted RND superfamily exporter protein
VKKIIVLVLILVLGVYYIYSENNSNVEVKQEKQDVISNVIVNNIENNVSKIKVKNIDIEKEVETFEENVISDEKLENNISDIDETGNEILVYSENNDFSDKNGSILNTNIDFIDPEELEIEMDSMFSDFLFEFSEKENLDPDDFRDLF